MSHKVRKSVPRGFGEKPTPIPRPGIENIHRVRSLDEILHMKGIGEWGRAAAIGALKDWLRDWEHFYRMNDCPDEQDVVATMLKSLENNDGHAEGA